MGIKNALAIFVVAIILSYIGLIWMPLNSFFVGDEGVKFIEIENLAEKGLDGIVLPYPGVGLDPDYEAYPLIPPYAIRIGEKIYSQWPLLYPLLVSLLYRLLGFHGLYLISIVSTLASLVALIFIGRNLGIKDKATNLLLVLFATPMFIYGVLLWEHAFALSLILISLVLYMSGIKNAKPWMLILSGICMGLAVWTRNESILFLLAAVIAYRHIRKPRDRIIALTMWMLSAGAVLAIMLITQKLTVGEFLGLDLSQFTKPGVATEITAFKSSMFALILYKIKLSAVLTFYRFGQEPWILIGCLWILFIFALWKDSRWWAWPALLVSSSVILVVSIWALINDPMRAGFFLNPVAVVFGLCAYKRTGENQEWWRFLTEAATIFAVLGILFAPATGGVQWGVRFILPATVILVFLGISVFNAGGNPTSMPGPIYRLLKSCFIIAVLMSVIWQASGLLTVRNDRMRDADLLLKLAGEPGNIIITDTFWLPQEMAAIFTIRDFYYVKNVRSYEHLVRAMAKQGIDSYVFVSADPNSKLKGNRSIFDILKVEVTGSRKLPAGFKLDRMHIEEAQGAEKSSW